MRTIPAILATQHPDNAGAPYWEKDGDGFVSAFEETEECVSCYRDLPAEEFMWDWEGKYADEAVIDKLFATYHDFFKKHQLGRDKFLTFRIPNVAHEKGYSLIRALMVILTSEDFAHDLGWHTPPLFEVILPMAEHADQIMYIETAFQKLAKFKQETFHHIPHGNHDVLEVIPLVEGVDSQINIYHLLSAYTKQHKKQFHKNPLYIRPFLARSDPALISGLVATVLGNVIALSEIKRFSADTGIPTYPIIGAGSLVFRGGLSPDHIADFLRQYRGARTVTIQSAFRYDYPLAQVKRAIQTLRRELPRGEAFSLSKREKQQLKKIIRKFTDTYQASVQRIMPDMANIFLAVPRRRERKLHIGLLAYGRKLGKTKLPRAISFTAGFYSVGIPPEFIGTGRAFNALTPEERELLFRTYKNFKSDLIRAGHWLNKDNLQMLAQKNKHWQLVAEDIVLLEKYLHITFGPKTREQKLHRNLSANLLLLKNQPSAMRELIVKTGKLRQSLG